MCCPCVQQRVRYPVCNHLWEGTPQLSEPRTSKLSCPLVTEEVLRILIPRHSLKHIKLDPLEL